MFLTTKFRPQNRNLAAVSFFATEVNPKKAPAFNQPCMESELKQPSIDTVDGKNPAITT